MKPFSPQELVDFMHSRGFDWDVETFTKSDGKRMYRVCFPPGNTDDHSNLVFSDSYDKAVFSAAIKALGNKTNE